MPSNILPKMPQREKVCVMLIRMMIAKIHDLQLRGEEMILQRGKTSAIIHIYNVAINLQAFLSLFKSSF